MTLDRSSGETVLELPASDAVDAMGVFQNQALLLTGSEIQGVDLISGEPQARDESLNEALYTPGANYQSMTSTTYPIVFAEEGDRLYYATEEGISRIRQEAAWWNRSWMETFALWPALLWD